MSFFGFIGHEFHSVERSIKHTAKNFAHDVSHAEKSVAKAVHHVEKQVEHAAKAVVHDTVQISKKAKQEYHSAERSIKHTAKHVTHEVAHAEKSVAKDVRHVAGQVENAAKDVEKSAANTAKHIAKATTNAEKQAGKAVKQMKTAISKYTESMVAFGKHVGKDMADSKVAKGVENLAKHPLETGEALLSVVGGEVETVGGTVLGVATSETIVGAVVGGAAVLDGVNNVVSGTGDLASIFNGNLSKVGTHNFAENMTKKYGGQAGDIAYLTVSMGLGLAAAPEAELSRVKDLVNIANGDIKLAAQGGKRLLQTVRSALDNGGESKLALAGVGERGTVSIEGVKQTASKSPVSLIKSG